MRSASHQQVLAHVPTLAAAMSQLIVHTASAAVVGDVYLAQFDDERSPNVLMRRILASLPPDLARINAQELRRCIRSDFDYGDVVNLQGWVLSRTEARLYALYAI